MVDATVTGSTASIAMSAERIVIVGAGPAGFATARAYRECGGSGALTLIGEEAMLPYKRPPLTKELLRDELRASELPIEPRQWFQDNDVRLLLESRASAIDPALGHVEVNDTRLAADAIVLASGSGPVRPQLPGMEDPEVLTVRTLTDSLQIAERASAGARMLVIGMGFIGCEIAASLAMRGAQVTLIGQEALPQVGRLGGDAARRIAGWLEDLGVRLVGGTSVREIDHGRVVELEDGTRHEGDCVVLGMGARPRGELAESAELPTREGAVVVDAQMRCARTGEGAQVLAVGDVAWAHNRRAGRHLRVEHWGDALEHGRIAGTVLAGHEESWESVPGFWSTIGRRTLKYAAWGDGYDEARFLDHEDGGFTVWYSRGGAAVGVLTHECDADYERGRELIGAGAPAP
jgi:3-phenylpropionate/trans-cinnamate dioxygenase ferredoxin reductase subunit